MLMALMTKLCITLRSKITLSKTKTTKWMNSLTSNKKKEQEIGFGKENNLSKETETIEIKGTVLIKSVIIRRDIKINMKERIHSKRNMRVKMTNQKVIRLEMKSQGKRKSLMILLRMSSKFKQE